MTVWAKRVTIMMIAKEALVESDPPQPKVTGFREATYISIHVVGTLLAIQQFRSLIAALASAFSLFLLCLCNKPD